MKNLSRLCLLSECLDKTTGFPSSSDGKSIHLQCGLGHINPWVGKIPLRRKWQLTPVFLPGEFHGQRSLVDYGPRGCKESNMTHVILITGFPGRAVVKNLPANAGDKRYWGSNPWVRKIPWRRIATHSNILAWKIP